MSRKLRAPRGTDEANFGGESYPVDNDGTVIVPDDAAPPLLQVGGFVDITEDEAKAEKADGLAQLAAPEGVASVSWGGLSHDVVDGHILVPVEAISDLAPHGFHVVEV